MTAEPTLGPDRSRRQVLCGLAVALLAPGAVVAACSSDSGASPTTGSSASPGGVLAKLSDVPVGGGTLVVGPNGRKLLLVQPKAGTVKAFDPTCPHQGFTVNPPQGSTMVCPGHGSVFNASTGAVEHGPATRGLTEVPVKISGGNVLAA